MPDYVPLRAELCGGDAHQLYRSIKRREAPPRKTQLLCASITQPPGRDHYAWETTDQERREKNVHVSEGVWEQEFRSNAVQLRHSRLLLPYSGQHPRRKLPPKEANAVRYLQSRPVKAGSVIEIRFAL